jgi:hypothetical protein
MPGPSLGAYIVSALTNALEEAQTGIVQPLSTARPMSQMGHSRHFGRGLRFPLYRRKATGLQRRGNHRLGPETETRLAMNRR